MISGSGSAVRRAAAALAALALTAGACTSASQNERASDAESASRLTIAVPEDVGPLNIFASHEEPLTELVYDKLLAPSPYVDDPQPWLAAEVRQLDPSTWEVDLRDGVTWHDGESFTADDVVFTFDFFKAAPTGRWTHHVSDVPTVETVEAVDDDTVRFVCEDACPFFGSVTLADLPIVAEHVWSGVPADQVREVTDLPVGTGPYRLVEYDPVTGYRFEAYDDYFGGPPVIRELIMPVIEDPSTTFTALRTGEIDATSRPLAPELIAEFSSSEDIELVTTQPLQFPELRMNFERTPFDVPEFRRAISRAIDRTEMLDTVFLGEGREADKGYPHPDSAWANPDLSTPTDVAEARSILDELGYEDTDSDSVREGPEGPLQFTIQVAATEPTDVRAAELIQQDLAQIGIAASVQTRDAATIGGLFRSRDFDLYINTITAHGAADPTQFIMSHRSGYLWRAPDIPYPQWDALFEKWIEATTIADRAETLFEMQELFNSQPTSVPLYYPDEHFAYRAGAFDGWVESPGYGIVHKWSLLAPQVGRDANAVVAGG
ncbi:MAG: ABC transporter substrate-binding protein [Actinomycetota bacterium]